MEPNQLPTWSNPWGSFFVAFQGCGLRCGQHVLLRPLVDSPLAIPRVLGHGFGPLGQHWLVHQGNVSSKGCATWHKRGLGTSHFLFSYKLLHEADIKICLPIFRMHFPPPFWHETACSWIFAHRGQGPSLSRVSSSMSSRQMLRLPGRSRAGFPSGLAVALDQAILAHPLPPIPLIQIRWTLGNRMLSHTPPHTHINL